VVKSIVFTPSAEDYEVKAWTRGKRLIIEADSPAQARSFKRQIVELMQAQDGESAIGFDTGQEE